MGGPRWKTELQTLEFIVLEFMVLKGDLFPSLSLGFVGGRGAWQGLWAGFASRKLILAAVSLEACLDSSQGLCHLGPVCASGSTTSSSERGVLICKKHIGRWGSRCVFL